jgi:hypothetical protein
MTGSADHLLCSTTAAALPGTWKLVPGRAITLRPVTDGILRIARGRVWATVDGPHGRTPDDSGDHVLQSGRSLYVRAGQRVVIEGWNADGASHFAWDPVCASAVAARPRLNPALVLRPLADLRLALALAARAGGQLLRGVALLAWHALGGRRAPAPGRRRPGLIG